jgi:hypothetical protein
MFGTGAPLQVIDFKIRSSRRKPGPISMAIGGQRKEVLAKLGARLRSFRHDGRYIHDAALRLQLKWAPAFAGANGERMALSNENDAGIP